MRNGWTGGQYSVFRAVFGVYLLIHFARLIPSAAALAVAAALAACCFVAGIFDRIAAIVLLCALAYTFARNPAANASLPLVGWMLLAHAFIPAAPFGSVAARKRIDPRGGWSMPQPIFVASWIVLAVGYAYIGYTRVVSHSWIDGVVAPMLLLHWFTFDPAWVPRLAAEKPDRVLYDGACGLCHRSVRFALAEDRLGDAFVFAPLALADTVVVETGDGRTLTKSAAVIRIAKRLGGLWRVLGTLLQIVPRPLRDAVYGFIARVRYKIFGTRTEACPMLPPDLRARFEH